jgi:hypothetical protein
MRGETWQTFHPRCFSLRFHATAIFKETFYQTDTCANSPTGCCACIHWPPRFRQREKQAPNVLPVQVPPHRPE